MPSPYMTKKKDKENVKAEDRSKQETQAKE